MYQGKALPEQSPHTLEKLYSNGQKRRPKEAQKKLKKKASCP